MSGTFPLTTAAASPSQLSDTPLEPHKFLRIFDAIQDAVVVFDRKGHIVLCNPACEQAFGVILKDAQGLSLEEVFEKSAPGLAAQIRDMVTSPSSAPAEITMTQNYQKKIFLLSTMAIETDGLLSEGMAVFHDMTKEKQVDVMRRDFVANVSHELRTPLSAINGYAETLLEGALQDEAVAHDFVQIIFNHSDRLSRLVRDLLDLSKLESAEYPTEFQATDLVQLIQKVVQLSTRAMGEKSIHLETDFPPGVPAVLAHDGPLEQVLTNLLDNAVKYTPSGGTVTVRLSTVDQDVQVDIEDTGIGIEAKHIPRLFERFYRVDKARSRDLGGTGLGLSIVKHIVQYHGGEVWVTSLPGKGSVFSFTLRAATKG